MKKATIKALAVAVPGRTLSNDYWAENHPESLEGSWVGQRTSEEFGLWEELMAPHAEDPFRGVVQRHFLDAGETVVGLEADAARRVLKAAKLEPKDIGLLIDCSFLPDSPGVGGAAFLAEELGLQGAVWNLEATCSGGLIASQVAASMIRDGQYKYVMVVTSCTYSRAVEFDSPLSWGVGDAATAMILGPGVGDEGFLGGHTLNTKETNGKVWYELAPDSQGQFQHSLRLAKGLGKMVRDTAEPFVRRVCSEALKDAGVGWNEVDFAIFNTPVAWYAEFCARTLGLDPARTINMYPYYANIGPALNGVNLYHAALDGRIKPGDRVLLYTMASVSSASAAVLGWGDVAVGAPPKSVELDAIGSPEPVGRMS